MSERVAADAAQAKVRDPAGSEVELQSLWAARPVVLVFLRHFG